MCEALSVVSPAELRDRLAGLELHDRDLEAYRRLDEESREGEEKREGVAWCPRTEAQYRAALERYARPATAALLAAVEQLLAAGHAAREITTELQDAAGDVEDLVLRELHRRIALGPEVQS